MLILSLVLIVGLIAIDQVIKYFTVLNLQAQPVAVIKDVFELTYVENRGGAWSIFENQRWFFIIITVVILGGIAYAFYKNMIYTNLGKISLIVVCAGAIGNFIDRLFRGFVVDMFSFKLINFPVFNFADICIVCGGIVFVYYIMFQHDAEKEKVQKNDR